MKVRLLIFFSILSISLSAQNLMQKADTAFAQQEYLDALNYYLKINKADEKNKRAAFMIGECFRIMNKYSAAVQWYETAMQNGYSEKEIWKKYGDVLVMTGSYDGALTAYQTYSKAVPSDEKIKLKIEACKYALANKDKAFTYKVTNESKLNSDASEYGICRIGNKIIFASTRPDENASNSFDQYTGQLFSDFFEATFNEKDSTYENVKKLKGEVNTKHNDGTSAYHAFSKTGYFSRSDGSKKENFNIYTAKYNEKDNSWNDVKPFEYYNKEYSVGHPAVTADGNTMFFVSSLPGGMGGKDIWMVRRSAGIWGAPVNAGPSINTIEDEMFPSVSGDSILYFSSNGLKGFGGLDIFSVPLINSAISGSPQNLNLPINSSADDFSIVFTSVNTGSFCSNRAGGKGDDDIWSFKLAPLELIAIGNIVESMKLKPMAGVKVVMKGSDGTEFTATTDSKGTYSFADLKPNITYTVSVTKKGYFGDAKTLATGNVKFSKEYSKNTGYDLDFGLLKLTKEEVEIPNIYYEFNSAKLNEYSKKSLDQLSVMLKETPNVKVSLNAHTDEQGSDDYNLKLSERRAQSVVDYLISTGIDSNRLIAKGFGESQPLIKDAKTDEEHSKNRRTTFKVTEK